MRKGFTLAELLIVIFLLGVLGLMAFGGVFSANEALDFARFEESVASDIRKMRSYALSGRKMADVGCGEESLRYGVYFHEEYYALFGETCSDFSFSYSGFGELLGREVMFSEDGYGVRVLDDEGEELSLPVSIFFESGSADLTIVEGDSLDNGEVVLASDSRYIEIVLLDDEKEREIVMLQGVGLPESGSYLEL